MFKKLFDTGLKELKRDKKIAQQVLDLEPEMQKLSDDELKAKTPYFKELLKNGKTLDDILPEAYAVVREASWRLLGMKPFFVQLCGGIAIHGGNIAEMRTGEGKSLTAALPAYLNALSGNGVHIITVNEYLAGREANGDVGNLLRWLGLTVGLNIRELDQAGKRAAYDCDVMYSTNSELGFDYLRDNMAVREENLVNLRGLNYAIIDEVDSVLIDEARTPLIISGRAKNTKAAYVEADTFVKSLTEDDYELDVESRTVQLLPSGVEKAQAMFHLENLYESENVSLVHRIDNAMKANIIFHNGVEYVVQDGEVLIVDSFTGRILKGRQYSDGLHQAIEAKEGVEIKQETVTVATITYQNFFRMYKKLSGMTGTAKTEEEEFRDIYNMYVVEVPTNRPIQRIDAPDLLFANANAKYEALIKEVQERHAKGQPILIGTVAVETSELISKKLTACGIKHEVLNAKNNEREAEIVAKAGQFGAVTIATNMAGRGTDIKLGEGVKELGGLCVFGTERHESRRIDNQLRGRSGRQGDPGYTRFYTSSEDQLMVRFGGENFKKRLDYAIHLTNGGDESLPLESKIFTRLVTNAQMRIEGSNYDSRKNVLKYDDVIRHQRESFYAERMHIIRDKSIEDLARQLMKKAVSSICYSHMEEVGHNRYDIDDEAITKEFNLTYFGQGACDYGVIKTYDEDQIIDYLNSVATNLLDQKKNMYPDDVYQEFLKVIVLRVLDDHWTEHIDKMDSLRQSVSLQSYGQANPLQIYQKKGLALYNAMLDAINRDVLKFLMRAEIRYNQEREDKLAGTVTNDSHTDTLHQPVKNVFKGVGQNDLCPCGSGKKFKYCHGRR
ncbi:MAG: preprotein translocase subunit SecA [Acholeplasmatales bacterium]|nr:preprotein translocase subunit SecA [Acholeplasmatales bacterium]